MPTNYSAQRLKQIRKRLRLTQTEYGQALGGYSRANVSNWEARGASQEILLAAERLLSNPNMITEAISPYSALQRYTPIGNIALPSFTDREKALMVPPVFAQPGYTAHEIGDISMMPSLAPGDIVVIAPSSVAKYGDINLILSSDSSEEPILRLLKFEGGIEMVHALNQSISPRARDAGESPAGFVVGLFRERPEGTLALHCPGGRILDKQDLMPI